MTYPKRKEDGGDGKDRITEVLKGLASRMSGLDGIVVIWDADTDAAKAFTDAADAFKFKDSPFTHPPHPFIVHPGKVKTAIFIVPGSGQTGTLEHLLYDAAADNKPDLAKCVEGLCVCSRIDERTLTENKKAKLKLATMIAVSCDEPTTTVAWVWHKKGNPIPVASPRFKELADFLTLFSSNAQLTITPPTP